VVTGQMGLVRDLRGECAPALVVRLAVSQVLDYVYLKA